MDSARDAVTGQDVHFVRLAGSGIFHDPNEVGVLISRARSCSAFTGCSTADPAWCGSSGSAPLVLFLYAMSLTQSRGALLALLAGLAVFLVARFGWRAALLAGLCRRAGAAAAPGRPTDRPLDGGRHRPAAHPDLERRPDARCARRRCSASARTCSTSGIGLVAHNSYLQCFVELGVFGGMLFLGAFYLAVDTAAAPGRPAEARPPRPGDGPAVPLRLRRRRRLGRRHDVADAVLHPADLHGAGPGDGVRADGAGRAAAAGHALRPAPAGPAAPGVAVVGFAGLYLFVRLFVVH